MISSSIAPARYHEATARGVAPSSKGPSHAAPRPAGRRSPQGPVHLKLCVRMRAQRTERRLGGWGPQLDPVQLTLDRESDASHEFRSRCAQRRGSLRESPSLTYTKILAFYAHDPRPRSTCRDTLVFQSTGALLISVRARLRDSGDVRPLFQRREWRIPVSRSGTAFNNRLCVSQSGSTGWRGVSDDARGRCPRATVPGHCSVVSAEGLGA